MIGSTKHQAYQLKSSYNTNKFDPVSSIRKTQKKYKWHIPIRGMKLERRKSTEWGARCWIMEKRGRIDYHRHWSSSLCSRLFCLAREHGKGATFLLFNHTLSSWLAGVAAQNDLAKKKIILWVNFLGAIIYFIRVESSRIESNRVEYYYIFYIIYFKVINLSFILYRVILFFFSRYFLVV